MILVWDNGKEYSDHEVEFVDIGDVDPKTAAECMCSVYGGTVLAAAPTVEWWSGGATDYAEWMARYVHQWEPKHVPTLHRCSPAVQTAITDGAARRLAFLQKNRPDWHRDIALSRALVDAIAGKEPEGDIE